MIEINLKIDQGIPQYGCSSCSNCHSIFGNSLCSIKNRGCCWYFPKFTLYEIHKMAKEKNGLETLSRIMNLPKVEVHNYFIHAKGYFDEVGYKNYINSGQAYNTDVKDKTIFFRACPFVEQGVGCTLPKRYRSYVCNFFICDEVVKKVESYSQYKQYVNERNNYVRWIEWENLSLETFLTEKKLNLVNNFDEVITILKDMPIRECEFCSLRPIVVSDEPNKALDSKLG
ncbi:hypothetical protein [Inconstantimicrobium mannanitabidum]|uniref:Uncharacterized protein n=1 Tax=Inconstantimicrobium mannanitabidum TaxID=1604901 RepID=A0ACB5RHD8_9CLOT|nr:hypothetical protein [Clostridium sp. TW13]GKX68516.1 hypothetical protein rsdtw13_37740 [Clostridium sp. TW13]